MTRPRCRLLQPPVQFAQYKACHMRQGQSFGFLARHPPDIGELVRFAFDDAGNRFVSIGVEEPGVEAADAARRGYGAGDQAKWARIRLEARFAEYGPVGMA